MKPPQPPVSYDVIHWCERVDGQPSPRVIQRCGKTREDAIAAWNTRALSTSVASGEGWSRDKLARWLGSFPMHEDDRGPDNTALIDLLPFTAGEDQGGETVLYRIVDGLLSTSPLPPNVPPVDDAFEVGSRVRPRGGTIQGELLEFNEPCTGALIRWDNGDEVWKALRNLVMIPPVDPTGDAQGLGEINLCPTCGALPCDQTQKLPPPVEAGVPSRADLHDMLAAAYEQGCLDVQANYQPDPDPEFGEAAHDYATSALALFNPSSDGGGRG
jgi:hypothetical protein